MRILLIEDARRIAAFVEQGLTEEGHAVTVVTDLASARQALEEGSFDVLVVDRRLPDGDGLDVIRTMRRQGLQTPAICLTARDQVAERVEGLRAGADDYVVKPFSFEELVARIERLGARHAPQAQLAVGDLEIDLEGHRVKLGGVEVELTAREFRLLVELARNADRVLTRTRLLEAVWGLSHHPGTNVVDVYIRYLRSKLRPELIRTVRGVGYSLLSGKP